MSEIYYKGTMSDMKSVAGYPPLQYSIGPVYNGSPEYGIYAFKSIESLRHFCYVFHSVPGGYGPNHLVPTRFFKVTGDVRELSNMSLPPFSDSYGWRYNLKVSKGFYGGNLVCLDNVQFIEEIYINHKYSPY